MRRHGRFGLRLPFHMGRTSLVALASGLVGVIVTVLSFREAPMPIAAVSRGSEEAFASGLHPRELRPRSAPLRWTSERASFRFLFLPGGKAHLLVRLGQHRTRVLVLADRVAVGALEPRDSVFETDLETGGRETIELATEGFVAGSRRLGASLDAVSLTFERNRFPPLALLGSFVIPAVVIGLGCLMASSSALLAVCAALGSALAQGAL